LRLNFFDPNSWIEDGDFARLTASEWKRKEMTWTTAWEREWN
jgi:hypothetical protein